MLAPYRPRHTDTVTSSPYNNAWTPGAIAKDRKRLRILELTAQDLQKAVIDIKLAQDALSERQERHGRFYDEDEDENEDDEDSVAKNARYDDRLLQTIFLSDREEIKKFIKEHAKPSDAPIEVRMDLDAAGVDFAVLEEYLEAKINRVRLRLLDAHRAFLSDFEAAVQAEASPFLIELYSAMHNKLPTELRNMIYAYLLPTGGSVYFQLPIFDPNFHNSSWLQVESDLETTARRFQAGTRDLDKPGTWLLNPAYTGRGMARDLAEIYYSSKKFRLEARSLSRFLREDRTGTRFKPMEHLRKSLDIFVRTTMGNGRCERAWASTQNEEEFLDCVYTNLKDLLPLSHMSEIPITISISTCSPLREPQIEGDRRFYNVMETVREPIYDLLHAGVKIKVEHVAICTLKRRVISEDPGNYFAMSKDEWHKERQSHGTSWRPSANFVTREDCQEDTLRRLLEQRWGHTKSIDSYSYSLD